MQIIGVTLGAYKNRIWVYVGPVPIKPSLATKTINYGGSCAFGQIIYYYFWLQISNKKINK